MSARKKKPTPVTPELLAATVARFGQALEECRERWVERWERPPRVRELVHPFEIVIAACPEDAVSDPDAFEAAWNPPHSAPPRPKYELNDFTVEPTPRHRLPGVAEYTLSTRVHSVLTVELFLMIEQREGTLLMDYWISDYADRPLTDAEAREVCLALVREFYLSRHPGASIQRVLLRPMVGLSDPEEFPLP